MSIPLFEPYDLAGLTLPNRFVMAPMTRGRSGSEGIPGTIVAEYYRQRATAGLIVTEATSISPQGRGWFGAPGVYTPAQIEGWKAVTAAVHAAGGHIFLQLWHMGRVSHPDFQEGGALPVGPSAIAAAGYTHTPEGKKDYVTPRALETSELAGIVEAYAHAASNAIEAGFDGVEIHAANGYLLDQFLRSGSNIREDNYGGSIENRARLLLEVTAAVTAVAGKHRTGVRISPTGAYNDMSDSHPIALFSYVATQLSELGIAYLHVMDPVSKQHMMSSGADPVHPFLRPLFHGTFILNGGYDLASATEALAGKQADLIAFGMPFLANPDFVERTLNGDLLNAPDYATLYSAGEEGYTNYSRIY